MAKQTPCLQQPTHSSRSGGSSDLCRHMSGCGGEAKVLESALWARHEPRATLQGAACSAHTQHPPDGRLHGADLGIASATCLKALLVTLII